MNSRFFNSISELNEYIKSLKITSEASFTQYLSKIHFNLLQRNENNIQKFHIISPLQNIASSIFI